MISKPFAAVVLALITACGEGATHEKKPGSESEAPQASTARQPGTGDLVFDFASINARESAGRALIALDDQAPTEVPIVDGRVVLRGVRAGLHAMQVLGPKRLNHRQVVEVADGSSAEEQSAERLRELACADVTAAKALPKFADLVTDPAQATKAPAGAKLHVITAYESRGHECATADQRGSEQKARSDGNYGVIRVKVSETNVALYLSSYQPVTWWIDVAPGGSVASITMSSHHQSSIVGVPSSVTKVLTSSFDGGQSDVTGFIENFEPSYDRVYSESEQRWVCGTEPSMMKAGTHAIAQAVITRLTGLSSPTSIQATYQGSAFFVAPETRGELSTTKREAGFCYKEADGSVKEYGPVE